MSSLFRDDRSCKRCPLVLFDTSTTTSSEESRRSFITDSFATATFIGSFSFRPHQAIAETDIIKLADVLAQVKDARGQMDDIPDLIKAEKWDAGTFMCDMKKRFICIPNYDHAHLILSFCGGHILYINDLHMFHTNTNIQYTNAIHTHYKRIHYSYTTMKCIHMTT